jgi:hypothetical protein
VLVRKLAMLVSSLRVILGLVVLAKIVMMRCLVMMMRGSVMMRGSFVMVLARLMWRLCHGHSSLAEISLRRTHSPFFATERQRPTSRPYGGLKRGAKMVARRRSRDPGCAARHCQSQRRPLRPPAPRFAEASLCVEYHVYNRVTLL